MPMRCFVILFAMLFLSACQPKVIYVTEAKEPTSAQKDATKVHDIDSKTSDGGYACGDQYCPTGTMCDNDKCYCGESLTPYLANAGNYICVEGEFVCAKSTCKCGEHGCGEGGRCENNQCVCGPNSLVAPKVANGYNCNHYQDEEHSVEEWVCADDKKACRCGDSFCGSGGVCFDDKSCRCEGTLAPNMNPERYICHNMSSMWLCDDKRGCPFAGGVCAKGELLGDNECVKPIGTPGDYDIEPCPEGENCYEH